MLCSRCIMPPLPKPCLLQEGIYFLSFSSWLTPGHPSKSISGDMSGKPHPPADGVSYHVPRTSSEPYTHILALFTFVWCKPRHLPLFPDCKLMDPGQRPTHLTPFCGDSACQESGLINYELKFTLPFRFRINEMKSIMI